MHLGVSVAVTSNLLSVRSGDAPAADANNMVLDREDISSANWSRNSVTVTTNIETKNGFHADRWAATGVGSNLASAVGISATAVHRYSIRALVKRENNDWAFISLSDQSAHAFGKYFNISTGVAGSNHAAGDGVVISSSITDAGSGWWNIQVDGYFTNTRTVKVDIRFTNADANVATVNGRTAVITNIRWYDQGVYEVPFPTVVTFYGPNNSASAVSLTYDGAIANGDLIILAFESANNTITAPTDYTPLSNTAAGTNRAQLFYKFANTGEAAPTLPDSGARNNASAIVFRHAGTPSEGFSSGIAASANTIQVDNFASQSTVDRTMVFYTFTGSLNGALSWTYASGLSNTGEIFEAAFSSPGITLGAARGNWGRHGTYSGNTAVNLSANATNNIAFAIRVPYAA